MMQLHSYDQPRETLIVLRSPVGTGRPTLRVIGKVEGSDCRRHNSQPRLPPLIYHHHLLFCISAEPCHDNQAGGPAEQNA